MHYSELTCCCSARDGPECRDNGEAFRDIYTMSSLQQHRWSYLLPSSVSNNSNIISYHCIVSMNGSIHSQMNFRESSKWQGSCSVSQEWTETESSLSRYLQYLQYLDRESAVITFHWSRSSLCSRCPQIIMARSVATCLCPKWKNHFTANWSSGAALEHNQQSTHSGWKISKISSKYLRWEKQRWTFPMLYVIAR